MPIGIGIGLSPLVRNGSVLNLYPSILNDGNTVAWYDYTDLTTITKNGSNLVALWKDKLLSGNDIAQATDDNKPVLTSTGILFDGTNDYLKKVFTLIQPTIVYAVLRQKTWTNGRRIWDGGSIGTGALLQSGTTPDIKPYAGTLLNANNELNLGEFKVVRAVYNGASSKSQINKNTAITGNAGAGNMGGFTLGVDGGINNTFSNIEVKEIIIRKISDSDADQTKIVDYLIEKYELDVLNTWLIAGQSNAMANDVIANQTILGYNTALTDGYIWNKNNSAFELITPGANTTYDRPTGVFGNYFGPETSFIKDLTSTLYKQYCIKLAWGSTQIAVNPAADDWNVGSTDELLDELKGLITDANAAATTAGKKIRIRGILWVQGEEDAGNEAKANAYLTNLTELMGNIKSYSEALNAANGVTAKPFINIISRLCINQTPTYKATVRTAQADFVTNQGGILIDTDAFALKVDNLHFTADSIIKIGQDSATAVKSIYVL